MGYTDIGRAAFGRAGGIGINMLCVTLRPEEGHIVANPQVLPGVVRLGVRSATMCHAVELTPSVALIVLFGDTLEVLFPTTSSNTWKLLGLVMYVQADAQRAIANASVLPTTLLPLHLLSLPSLLSTISTFLLVLTVLLDGFIKTSSPGSIIHPAETSFGPELTASNWLGGIGLVMAGFGGHAVVPSLARDMRHPENFDKVSWNNIGTGANVFRQHEILYILQRLTLGHRQSFYHRRRRVIHRWCRRIPHDRQ